MLIISKISRKNHANNSINLEHKNNLIYIVGKYLIFMLPKKLIIK